MSGRPDNLGRMAASWRGRRVMIALAAVLDARPCGLRADRSADDHSQRLAPGRAAAVVEKPSPERKRLIEAFGGVY